MYITEDTIISITPYGVHDVWDIEVEDDHSYCTCGFINHNSSSSPNMQNIPSRETSEFRECFIARPGNKLVVVDFTQQEIGIVAYIAGDERMLEIFNSGQDIYIQMAKLVHKKDITKDDPLRKQMKSVVLGLDYGMSVQGLADKEEIELEEAQEIMDKFFETFPTLKKWMLGQEKIKDKVYTIMGRRIYLNPYSGQCDRNAKNFPIQGSAADMMKITLARVFEEWKWDYPFAVVATVHDETVLDVPETIAQEVADFVATISSEVANTMCNQIPMNFRVTVSICNDWSEKE